MSGTKNDWLTVAAIGLIAMCAVTFDHEALGHGSVCLLLGGHIRVLTSSIFRCDVRSGWIDPAGPVSNLLIGTLALICMQFVPARLPGLKLFFIVVTAFSYFWEGGYVIQAAYKRFGDLYFFVQFLQGGVALWQRWAMAVAGLVLYVFTIRLTSRSLRRLFSDAAVARSVARTVWVSATIGAGFAGLAYRGQGWGNFRDAVLEIGAASLPLLFIPAMNRTNEETGSSVPIARSYATVALAIIIFGTFAATMGQGTGMPG